MHRLRWISTLLFLCVSATGCATTLHAQASNGPWCWPSQRAVPSPQAGRVQQRPAQPAKPNAPPNDGVIDRIEDRLREKLRAELREHLVAELQKLRPQLHAQLSDVMHQELALRNGELVEKVNDLATNHEGLAGRLSALTPKVSQVLASHPEIAGKLAALAADATGAAAFGKIGLIAGPAGGVAGLVGGLLITMLRRKRREKSGAGPQPPASGPATAAGEREASASWSDQFRTHSQEPDASRSPAVEPALVGGGVETRTEYVRVPVVNQSAEALREAMRREAQVNPQARSVLARVESVADQLLHGLRASGQAVSATTDNSKPGMKDD